MMTISGLKSGLFSQLLAVCVTAALICAALATIIFHSYRDTITQNRLTGEISAQAEALAPLAVATMARSDVAATAGILQAFAGLNYVTCVELLRDRQLRAAWPMPGCDNLDIAGTDRNVDVALANGSSLTFKVRVDLAHLYAPIWRETIIVAACSMVMALIIFLALTFSFFRHYIISSNDVHLTIILGHHDDAEGGLFAFLWFGLWPLYTIANDILHQFDKNRKHIANLGTITRVILQSGTKRIANSQQNVFRDISRVAEHEFIAQQQLAEFKETVKLHHNADLLPSINFRTIADLIFVKPKINFDSRTVCEPSGLQPCCDACFPQYAATSVMYRLRNIPSPFGVDLANSTHIRLTPASRWDSYLT